MLHFLPLVPLGFVVGAYGTLIGAGGGFVLVPVLLVLYPHERPEVITAISLAVIFFNAASGSVAYARMKRIDYTAGLWFSAAAVPGAILGALSTSFIPRRTFDALFGALLLLISAYLFVRPHSKHTGPESLLTSADDLNSPANLRKGSVLSVFVGYFSSLLGIGGGIIHVPALVRILRFPVHIATATSHFILAFMALTATLSHVATGVFHHGVRRSIALSIGVVIGAQLGARLSTRLSGNWILRGLAVALALVGIRILLIAVGL
jgi:uncharacterized membrane protein YfcA